MKVFRRVYCIGGVAFWILAVVFPAFAGEHDSEIAEYQKIITQDATNLDATYQLGNFLAWDGRYDEALQVYRDILAKEPNYLDAEIGIARVHAWRGDQREAVSHFEAILSQHPDNFEAYEGLGSLALWANDFAKSVAYFKRTLELNPRDLVALKGIGRAYMGQGDRRLADKYLTKAQIVELQQTSLLKMVLIVGGVALVIAVIVFLMRSYLRHVKREVLTLELQIIRYALALHDQIVGRFPLALENLCDEKWRAVGDAEDRPYLAGIRRSERGFLLDPFGRRYWYNPDTGRAHSTTKGCENW